MAAPVVTLAPGVHRIPTLGDYINSFAFVDDDGQVTLVDTGLSRAPTRIVAALTALGTHPSQVTRIVLTHAHLDHAGGAARLLARTAARGVAVHEHDADFVRTGSRPPQDPTVTGAWLFARVPWGGFAPAAVREALHDGQLLPVAGGLRVVHTPGHTPGHVALLHQPTGVLITGDSIFNMNHRLGWPVAAFCTSARQNQQTAHVLADLEYDVAAFTHGPEIRARAREQVRGFLARQRR